MLKYTVSSEEIETIMRTFMCKLSIIVPVYNMAADGKLEYCINSLLNQTITDYEIITVDDKSTDNSLEVLRSFEKQHPDKIRVIESEENGRQGAAKNKGILASRGEYLGFIDADDWLLPDTYECAIKKAEEAGADVVGFDMCNVYEHTMNITERIECNEPEQAGVMDHEKRARLLLHSGPFVTKVYRREFFFDAPFSFPEKMSYEDNAVAVEFVMRIKHFEYIPEVKYFYYQNSTSTTHSVSQKNIDDRLTASRMVLESARKWGIFDEFYKELEFVHATRFYATTLLSYMQSDIKHSVGFIKKLGDEMKAEFPNFMKNADFLNVYDEEQKKLLALQQKNSLVFFLYYELKKFYRMKRYGRW